jgi:tyrosyl-tRNA synthetase
MAEQLGLVDIIRLGQNFPIQQFLARDNFAKRLEKEEPIYLHETFYALLQGYDAVAQQTDVQVGGSEQLFNIIVAGRKLQEAMGQRPLVGVLTGILPGTDGELRMSKSTGNIIPINSGAEDMYGKLMSVPDFAMKIHAASYRWRPRRSMSFSFRARAIHLGRQDEDGQRYRIFYGEAEAAAAEAGFVRLFQKGQIPEVMEEIALLPGASVAEVLMACGLASSKSEARRLVTQRGVRLDGETLEHADAVFPHPGVLHSGIRRFIRVK